MTKTPHEHEWDSFRLGTQICQFEKKHLDTFEWEFCAELRKFDNGEFRPLTQEERDEIHEDIRKEYS